MHKIIKLNSGPMHFNLRRGVLLMKNIGVEKFCENSETKIILHVIATTMDTTNAILRNIFVVFCLYISIKVYGKSTYEYSSPTEANLNMSNKQICTICQHFTLIHPLLVLDNNYGTCQFQQLKRVPGQYYRQKHSLNIFTRNFKFRIKLK